MFALPDGAHFANDLSKCISVDAAIPAQPIEFHCQLFQGCYPTLQFVIVQSINFEADRGVHSRIIIWVSPLRRLGLLQEQELVLVGIKLINSLEFIDATDKYCEEW